MATRGSTKMLIDLTTQEIRALCIGYELRGLTSVDDISTRGVFILPDITTSIHAFYPSNAVFAEKSLDYIIQSLIDEYINHYHLPSLHAAVKSSKQQLQ